MLSSCCVGKCVGAGHPGFSAPAMPTVYKAWCPCPQLTEHGTKENATACKKGNALLAKNVDEARVRESILNHLMFSPYHNLPEELARQKTEECEVIAEEWSEDEPQELLNQQEKKRPRLAAGIPRLTLDLPACPDASVVLPANSTVTLRTSELQLIIDSVKRAALNVRNAERLCDSAATAFRMEATALEAAHAQLSMALAYRAPVHVSPEDSSRAHVSAADL
jgi:hypothetical protein